MLAACSYYNTRCCPDGIFVKGLVEIIGCARGMSQLGEIKTRVARTFLMIAVRFRVRHGGAEGKRRFRWGDWESLHGLREGRNTARVSQP